MNKFINILIAVLIIFSVGGTILAEESRESRGSKIVSGMKFPELEIVRPEFEKFVLPNGLTVYLMEDRESRIIKLEAMIRTGSFYDTHDRAGLAGLAGYVIKSGGSVSDPDAFNRQLDELGISFYSEIDMESGVLRMDCLKEDADVGLEIFRQVLMDPCYNEKTLLFCKTQVEETLRRVKDSPNSILRNNFRKLIYGDFPYSGNSLTIGSRYNVKGTVTGINLKTLANINTDDLGAFHKEYFCPQNVIIGIAGNFRKDNMADKIKNIFSGWEKKATRISELPSLAAKISANPGIFFISKSELTQSTLIMGHIVGQVGADKLGDDYFALKVLGEVLGGSFGARLPAEIRVKRGLAYSVNGYFSLTYTYPGIFAAFAQTKSESTAEVIKIMINEIGRMKDCGITNDELKIAKEAMQNTFVFNFISKGGILKQLIRNDYFNLPESHLIDYLRHINKITKEDVLSAARKYLHPDKMTILVIGNLNIQKELEKEFDKVNIINID